MREIEHQLVDAAVQAPITNPLLTHAVSDRAENVQVHPQWGLMLRLIWSSSRTSGEPSIAGTARAKMAVV